MLKSSEGSVGRRLGALVVSAALVSSLGACGEPAAPGRAFGESATLLGREPSVYYGNFVFRARGDCAKPGTRVFEGLGLSRPVRIGPDGEADVFADLRLELSSDGLFRGRYSEQVLNERRKDSDGYRILFERPVAGRWRTVGKTLLIEGIGRGLGVSLTGDDKLLFHFDPAGSSSQIGDRLRGRVAEMGLVRSWQSVSGVTAAQTCSSR